MHRLHSTSKSVVNYRCNYIPWADEGMPSPVLTAEIPADTWGLECANLNINARKSKTGTNMADIVLPFWVSRKTSTYAWFLRSFWLCLFLEQQISLNNKVNVNSLHVRQCISGNHSKESGSAAHFQRYLGLSVHQALPRFSQIVNMDYKIPSSQLNVSSQGLLCHPLKNSLKMASYMSLFIPDHCRMHIAQSCNARPRKRVDRQSRRSRIVQDTVLQRLNWSRLQTRSAYAWPSASQLLKEMCWRCF